ncbi:MAG: hypothetical protein AAB495_00480 [Patescibacteria group bacterium]
MKKLRLFSLAGLGLLCLLGYIGFHYYIDIHLGRLLFVLGGLFAFGLTLVLGMNYVDRAKARLFPALAEPIVIKEATGGFAMFRV